MFLTFYLTYYLFLNIFHWIEKKNKNQNMTFLKQEVIYSFLILNLVKHDSNTHPLSHLILAT